jgi:uncharacterized protein YndB with AHSA1/START domain
MKTIHHVVDIDAPPTTVWRALTDQEQMSCWWSTQVKTSEPALGVRSHWTFAADFNPVMEITTLEPPHQLVWRCVGGHDPWADNTFRFTIAEAVTDRCRLRFWQDYAVELDDDAFGIYNFNWGYYLESLRLLCAAGTGRPYSPTTR